MKKLIIITRLFPKDSLGGGESVIYNIWKRFRKHYNTNLISGWNNNPNLLPKGTYTVNLKNKNRFIRYCKLYFYSKKIIKKIKPDLILTNATETPKFNKPTIIIVHHLGHFFYKIHRKNIFMKLMLKFQKQLIKRRLNQAKHIIAVSNSTKNDIIKLGINPRKIDVIYNGIEINKFKPNKIRKGDKINIVVVSRFSREKGQDIAIKSLRYLPKNILNKVKLIIVGFVSDKSFLSELKKMAIDLPVEFKENVSNIEYYYNLADIVIFPTLMYEGFGLIATEAMACEKAVIASNFPAIKEVIQDNGILFEPGNYKVLANSISKLIKNKKLRIKLGKQGRKFVIKNFTWDIAFKKYKKILEGI